jgi:E3 ubiquitin-protein ligase HECTD1
LLLKPLPSTDARLPEVERRFCMLGRLMAKALREGFVVPLPLTATFFQLVLGGVSGVELCEDGANRIVTVENVEEFVQLAASFWLHSGVQRQLVAFRRGLYDVLGNGAIALWAFSAAELRRLFCGEDEVVWTEKELKEHLQCGGGFSQDSLQIRWLLEDLVDMPQPKRAKFLEFVTSCPRLPPGGLKELQMSVHPDMDKVAGLPRSRACAHRLFLPKYASREELVRQVNEAILSSGGHHEQSMPP